jgi:hypothetical protein
VSQIQVFQRMEESPTAATQSQVVKYEEEQEQEQERELDQSWQL